MRSRAFIRPSVLVVFGMLTFSVGLLAVLAEQEPRRETLTTLARHACESGFVSMLGLGQRDYSLRVVRSGPRVLMVPAAQCRDEWPFETKSATLIISHAFENRQGVREGYFYLTNQRGDLLNVVHFQEDRRQLFSYVRPDMPAYRSDFETEKGVWLSRVAERAALHRFIQ